MKVAPGSTIWCVAFGRLMQGMIIGIDTKSWTADCIWNDGSRTKEFVLIEDGVAAITSKKDVIVSALGRAYDGTKAAYQAMTEATQRYEAIKVIARREGIPIPDFTQVKT